MPSEKSSSAEEDSWSKLSQITEKLKSMAEEFDRKWWCDGSMGTTSCWERSWETEILGLAARLGASERNSVAAIFSVKLWIGKMYSNAIPRLNASKLVKVANSNFTEANFPDHQRFV